MFRVVDEPISVETLTAAVADPDAGAIVTFIGTTRATNRGRRVLRLEYEAYAEMALSQLEQIAELARARWQLCGVAIVHRVGIVPLGEASVVIAVSAPHRREAIEACHFCIDRLKLVAPIWKKEHFEGGEVWIGSLADCDHGDDEEREHGHADPHEGAHEHGHRHEHEHRHTHRHEHEHGEHHEHEHGHRHEHEHRHDDATSEAGRKPDGRRGER